MALLPIKTVTCATFDDFAALSAGDATELPKIAAVEAAIAKDASPFELYGYCAACGIDSPFLVDFHYAPPAIGGKRLPNWRERLECRCGLNNRMRAALHFLRSNLSASASDLVYVTEQITPLFRAFERHFPLLIGSEFLRDGTEAGTTNNQHIRHEDVTKLAFPDGRLDFIASFDVLEHVPDYGAALREFFRCLRKNGKLLLSVPFFTHRKTTLTRAKLDGHGHIEHLESPEFHGDPLDVSGVLCFYHFGWDFLDDIRAVGFFMDISAVANFLSLPYILERASTDIKIQ